VTVRFSTKALKQIRWRECAVRFFFGGVMTAATGLVAKTWGPVVGGLFLDFPAIFPAAATLIERHERRKKEKKNQPGKRRGRTAAALDSAGASLGAIGLLGFGGLVWGLAGRFAPWLPLVLGAAAGLGISSALWMLRRKLRSFRRQVNVRPPAVP